MNNSRGHLRGALALLRLQLLPSALADIFAGAALAGGLSAGNGFGLCLTLLGSACLYLGGMVMNDVADATRDRELAAARPIPSGLITRTWATILATLLLLTAVLLLARERFHVLPICMVLGILLYDFVGNRHPWLGAPLLGSLRAANLLLGYLMIAQSGSATEVLSLDGPLFVCALAYAIYIAAAVLHGSLEDEDRPSLWKSRLYLLTAAICPVLPALWLAKTSLVLLGAMPTAWLVARALARKGCSRTDVAARTGILLRGISRFSLCLCLGTGRILESGIVLALAYVLPLVLRKKRWS